MPFLQNSGQALDWLNDDVSRLRSGYETEHARPLPAGASWQSIDTETGPIRVLAHAADRLRDTRRRVVYFHGGELIVGSPATHLAITTALSQRTGSAVYSVDYRLAPDHSAQAPVEDGLAVIAALAERDRDSRFVIAGDAAGAAIAMAVEAGMPDTMRNRVDGVCSLYGAYGHFDEMSHVRRGRRAHGTDLACRQRFWDLAHGKTASPYRIKALARHSHVPVFMLAGDVDPLCDDTLVLAEALQKCGRTLTVELAAGADHGFLRAAATDPVASKAMDMVAAWISGL